MSDSTAAAELIQVPDFRGMQALNAWLAGHDAGLLLEGPDPDSPDPLLNGIVVAQTPEPGLWLHRWDVVTVWLRDVPGLGGVREPRRPYPPTLTAAAETPEHAADQRHLIAGSERAVYLRRSHSSSSRPAIPPASRR